MCMGIVILECLILFIASFADVLSVICQSYLWRVIISVEISCHNQEDIICKWKGSTKKKSKERLQRRLIFSSVLAIYITKDCRYVVMLNLFSIDCMVVTSLQVNIIPFFLSVFSKH